MIKLQHKTLIKVNPDDTPCWLQGLVPEAKAYGIFLLWKKLKTPLFYLIPKQTTAENIYESFKVFLKEGVFLLPYKENNAALYELLHKIRENKVKILIGSLKNAIQPTLNLKEIELCKTYLKRGAQVKREELIRWLVENGYFLSPLVEEKGEYAVRGCIVDFYCPSSCNPVRIEFFGDKIDSIREFNPSTQLSLRQLEEFTLYPAGKAKTLSKSNLRPFFEVLSDKFLFILDEPLEIEEEIKKLNKEDRRILDFLSEKAKFYTSCFPQKREWTKVKKELSFTSYPLSFYAGNLDLLLKDIKNWQKEEYTVTFIVPTLEQAKRFKELLQEREIESLIENSFTPEKKDVLAITLGDIQRGFVFEETKQVIISDGDIFKKYKKRRKKAPFEQKIKSWTELKEGDYVVHVDYGIGRFKGLVTLKVRGKWGDYFRVDYKGSDRLYVPFNQLDRLHKYVGNSDTPPPIYSLEGSAWETTKERVRKATRELALSLLELYSARKTQPGFSFSPDTPWQLQFEASFPYEETPDQLIATQEVKKDMESPKPMDRLICGDSGYGKTEVAIRASFKAVMDSKQVAVLVPTTILAEQHFRTFSERMADYPVRIEMLSRFQSSRKQKEIIKDLEDGKVDIVIGTHRLLQNDIKFKDLGLLIIDEEHRFGVTQKKKLKEIKKTVDVLTLSATPIPRSLYMALTGIYNLSTIFSPPQERQEVEVEVAPYNDKTIKEAISRELLRKGQVFYLYNRVRDIHRIKSRLEKMFPESKIAVAHGQMSSSLLEKTISGFIKGKYDILVCTSIIESGIDMPNVNTLIVENSEQFGLADLYQLRGRVGRGKRKGYAYFLFNPGKALTDEAKKRLQIIHQFKGSGAGLKVAMEDLQIRGAGNLLGKEQHGHIASVGFTLYSQLLTEEIKKLKGEKVKPSFPVQIELGMEARIPETFVPVKEQRMQLYQKIGEIEDKRKLLEFQEELQDRFGPLPPETQNLIHLLQIKLVAKEVGICSISENYANMIQIKFSHLYPLTEEKKEKIKSKFSKEVKTFPGDNKTLLILKPEKEDKRKLLFWLKEFLQKLKDVLI